MKRLSSFTVFVLFAISGMSQPKINSFSVASSPVNSNITINGTNFSPLVSGNIVYFGPVKAAVTSATATALTVTVPPQAGNPVLVTVNGLTAYAPRRFYATPVAGYSKLTASSYLAKTDSAIGSNALDVVVGDFDGDGKADVAVTNFADGTLSVLRNSSDTMKGISFAPRLDTRIETYVRSVATGDLDGDGKLDLVISNSNSDKLSILRNTSVRDSISFAPKIDSALASGSHPDGVSIADIDGDGKPDIVAVSYSANTLIIFRNTSLPGNLSFARQAVYTTGTTCTNIAIDDFDADGLIDIAVINQGSRTFSIFRNTSSPGTISLSAKVDFPTLSSCFDIVSGDLNFDGKPEIIISNNSLGSISIFKNTSAAPGNIAFSSYGNFRVGSTPQGIAIGDMDGDGMPDIAVTNFGSNTVSVFTTRQSVGNDPYVFDSTHIDYPAGGAYSLAVNDLDGDGRAEIILGDYFNAKLSVLKNGKASLLPRLLSFTPQKIFSAGDSITLKGYNLTGTTLVMFAGQPAKSFAVKNDSVIVAIPAKPASGQVLIATALGRDSLPGFVYVAVPKITSFSPASAAIGAAVTIRGSNFESTAANNAVYFGSIKAQVSSATDSALVVTVPAGAGCEPINVTARKLTAYSTSAFNVSFDAPADLNFAKGFVKQKPDSSLNGYYITYMYNMDLDGDGRRDLVALIPNGGGQSAPGTHPGAILVAKNTKTGDSVSFGSKQVLITGLNPSKVAYGDLDGDGKPELVTANMGDNTISVFRNKSAGGNILFDTARVYTVPSYIVLSAVPNQVAIADMNGDGKPDIVATIGNTPLFYVFLNNSDSSLSFNRQAFTASPDSWSSGSFSINDLDNDGKPDLAFNNTADTSNHVVTVLKNVTTGGALSFATRKNFSTGFFFNFNADDLDGDGKTDLIMGNNGSRPGKPNCQILQNKSGADSLVFISSYLTTGNTFSSDVIIDNFDGSGKPALMISSSNGDSVLLMKGNFSAQTMVFNQYKYPVAGTSAYRLTAGDFDGDGRPDFIGNDIVSFSVYLNKLSESTKPAISRFTPTSGSMGETITIKGTRFTGITGVSFGGSATARFTVVSDSVITAVIGVGSSGAVTLSGPKGTDSLNGFTYLNPDIILPDSSKNKLVFTSTKSTYSASQYFPVTGKRLTSLATVKASSGFQVSLSPDTGFDSLLTLPKIVSGPADSAKGFDSVKVYVRFKNDSITSVTGTVSISANMAVTRTVSLLGNICDSLIAIVPTINSIAKDSTICIRDSITLGTSASGYAMYRWSTGDSTRSFVLKNSATVSLRVGSNANCLSVSSPVVNIIKNTNPIPAIAQLGDSTLLSSNAPNYRWFLNNIATGDTAGRLVVRKVGLYRVETSNDRVCWDKSGDYPFLVLATRPVNDSVSVKLYPNPGASGSVFNVVVALQRSTNVVVRVTVTDALGNTVLQTSKFIFFGREIKIPVTLTTKGTMFIKADINGDSKTVTVIVQ